MGTYGAMPGGYCALRGLSRWVQPPDAENRTSGGVGEVTDTIRCPDPIAD
ncbi:hypothetical protein [Nitrosomonas sp. Nm58]|nr:hypothetical protein [Nitrosomonas sp. Nm58]